MVFKLFYLNIVMVARLKCFSFLPTMVPSLPSCLCMSMVVMVVMDYKDSHWCSNNDSGGWQV